MFSLLSFPNAQSRKQKRLLAHRRRRRSIGWEALEGRWLLANLQLVSSGAFVAQASDGMSSQSSPLVFGPIGMDPPNEHLGLVQANVSGGLQTLDIFLETGRGDPTDAEYIVSGISSVWPNATKAPVTVTTAWGTATSPSAAVGSTITLQIVPDISESAGDPVTLYINPLPSTLPTLPAGITIDSQEMTGIYMAGGETYDVSPQESPPPGGVPLKIGDTFTLNINQTVESTIQPGSTDEATEVGSWDLVIGLQTFPKLPDLSIQSINWHTSSHTQWNDDPDNAGGVDIAYTITGSALPQSAPVALYWVDASGKKLGAPITTGENGAALMTRTAVNSPDQTYTIHVPSSQLGDPPKGSAGLMAALDPPGGETQDRPVLISADSDTTQTFATDATSILEPFLSNGTKVDPVDVEVDPDTPAEIDATFRPAAGALSLTQAAQLLGVDHFNWLQTWYEKPDSWTVYRSESGSHALLAPSVVGSGVSSMPPLPDPDTHPDADIEVQYAPGAPNGIVAKDGNTDSYPYYFNEPLAFDPAGIDAIEGVDVLRFNDSPRFSPIEDEFGNVYQPYGPDQYVGFSTILAGVNNDDTYSAKTFPGTQTGFSWQTDATFAGGGIDGLQYLRVFNPGSSVPPVTSGGVLGVQVFTENPPVLAPISDQTVGGGDTASLAVSATDSNPSATLTYSLDPGSPSGAAIDPNTGSFAWTVPLAQTPGDYPVSVHVSDNGNPPLGSSEIFTIHVNGPMSASKLQFTQPSYTANATDGHITIPITRSGDLSTAVTVVVSIPAGIDVSAFQQTVSFGPNSQSAAVTVPIQNDGHPGRPDVAIPLSLSFPSPGATLGMTSTATLIVHDTNPFPPLVTVTSVQRTAVRITTGSGKRKKMKTEAGLLLQFSDALAGTGNAAAYHLRTAATRKGKITFTKNVPLTVASATATTVTLVPSRKLNPSQAEQLRVTASALLDAFGVPARWRPEFHRHVVTTKSSRAHGANASVAAREFKRSRNLDHVKRGRTREMTFRSLPM